MASKFEAGQRVRVTDKLLQDFDGSQMLGKEFTVERPFGKDEAFFSEDGVVVIAGDGLESFLMDKELEAAQ